MITFSVCTTFVFEVVLIAPRKGNFKYLLPLSKVVGIKEKMVV